MLVTPFASIFSQSVSSFFHLVCFFFSCEKAFEFEWVPFIYFCFYFHYSRRQIEKIIAAFYATKCFA